MFRVTDANQEFFRDFGKVLDDISLGVREGELRVLVQYSLIYYAERYKTNRYKIVLLISQDRCSKCTTL